MQRIPNSGEQTPSKCCVDPLNRQRLPSIWVLEAASRAIQIAPIQAEFSHTRADALAFAELAFQGDLGIRRERNPLFGSVLVWISPGRAPFSLVSLRIVKL